MKSRISASIYLFSAGARRRNSRNGVSSRSIVFFFGRRHCQVNSSFQAEGFESSCRAIHSSVVEDEDFSELGPEISQRSPKQIKLVTEKPHHLVKTDPSRREAARPLSPAPRPRVKEIVASIGRASPSSNSKLGGHSPASTFTDDTKKISNIETPGSVSIKNIHPKVGLYELVESASVFGKISGASFVPASNGLRCCNIEYEDVESSRRALLASKITVAGHVFPVHPLDAMDVVAIRIENINRETTDYAIHSRCKSIGFGEFVGLSRTSKDVVDAFFNVQDDKIHNILENLNKTILDRNCWSARMLPSKPEPSEESPNEEAKYNLDLQIFDQFSKLRSELVMKKIAIDDLELLNASIMHITGQPPSADLSNGKGDFVSPFVRAKIANH